MNQSRTLGSKDASQIQKRNLKTTPKKTTTMSLKTAMQIKAILFQKGTPAYCVAMDSQQRQEALRRSLKE
jgi:hypothetical protein